MYVQLHVSIALNNFDKFEQIRIYSLGILKTMTYVREIDRIEEKKIINVSLSSIQARNRKLIE